MLTERTLTDFLQHSGEVLPEVDRGEVRLRRRGADDVVLVAGRHWDRVVDSIRVVAEELDKLRAVLAGVRADELHAVRAAAKPFATDWIGLLRPDDRAACIDELERTLLASLASGRLADVEEAVDGWRATALATWDQERNRARPGYAAEDIRSLPRP